MFEQSFVSKGRSHRSWTLIASTALQALGIVTALAVPLIWVEGVPAAVLRGMIVAPAVPPAPAPPAPAARPAATIREVFDDGQLRAPARIPEKVLLIAEQEAPFAGPGPGVPGLAGLGSDTANLGVLGSILSSAGPAPPPPPLPAERPSAAPPPPAVPVRVSSAVQSAKLIHKPVPVYPPLARQARIQGTVKIEAVVGKDGVIRNLRVLAGHPLLVRAALDAVSRWRYKPTTLGGDPVEVITVIDVNFTLQ